MLNLLVLPASVYLLIVSMCIANRMTRRTKMTKRLIFAGVGFIAAWSFSRAVMFEWILTPTNFALALLVMGVSIVMAFFPRVRV
jgi:hypothetical protein